MSDTPRTDAIQHKPCPPEMDFNGFRLMEYKILARTLEWENAELTAELAEYERTVAHMRDGARLQDSATAAVMERAEKAEAEVQEQCRLLAMGSERESRLMARVAELERDAGRWNQLRTLMENAHAAFVSANEHRLSYEEIPPEGPVSIQWYPNTPVGFNIVHAETIDAAIDAMRGTE